MHAPDGILCNTNINGMKKIFLTAALIWWGAVLSPAQDSLSARSAPRWLFSAGGVESFAFSSVYGDTFFNKKRAFNPGLEAEAARVLITGKVLFVSAGLGYAHYDYVMKRDVREDLRHLRYVLHQWADRLYIPLYFNARIYKKYPIWLTGGIRIDLLKNERYHYYIIDTGNKIYEDFNSPKLHKLLRRPYSLLLGVENKRNDHLHLYLYLERTASTNVSVGVKYIL